MTASRDSLCEFIQGKCPMCCGSTLFVDEGGYVTCSWERCPKPDAATELLANAEKLWRMSEALRAGWRLK